MRTVLKIETYTGVQTARADGDKEIVYVLQVFEDLDSNGALSFDDTQIFEGWNKGHAMSLGIFFCSDSAVVERIADEYDLDIVLAKHFCLVDLLTGRDDGHEHDAFYAQLFTAVGEALGMVAAT